MEMTYIAPSPPPMPKIVKASEVYGCRIPPPDFEIVSFRPPAPGDIIFFADGSVEKTSVQWPNDSPRYILKPKTKPKKVRVVRVLEYIGPEEWIDVTMARNAVRSHRAIFSVSSDMTIRELALFEEEVKENQ